MNTWQVLIFGLLAAVAFAIWYFGSRKAATDRGELDQEWRAAENKRLRMDQQRSDRRASERYDNEGGAPPRSDVG
jgi:hypothetical protein